MPHPQLWIHHPRPIIVLFQSTPVTELLILQFLPVVAVLVLRILRLYRLIRYPCHRQSKRIIVILLQHRPAILPHAQIVKENPYNSASWHASLLRRPAAISPNASAPWAKHQASHPNQQEQTSNTRTSPPDRKDEAAFGNMDNRLAPSWSVRRMKIIPPTQFSRAANCPGGRLPHFTPAELFVIATLKK